MTGGAIKGTELTVDGADIRVVDVPVDKVGDLSTWVHDKPAMVRGRHQCVKGRIIVQCHSLFGRQSKRCSVTTGPLRLPLEDALPIHVIISLEVVPNDALNVFDGFRTICGQHHRSIGSDQHIILDPNANVGIPFRAIDIWPPCSEVKTGLNR